MSVFHFIQQIHVYCALRVIRISNHIYYILYDDVLGRDAAIPSTNGSRSHCSEGKREPVLLSSTLLQEHNGYKFTQPLQYALITMTYILAWDLDWQNWDYFQPTAGEAHFKLRSA